VRGSLRSDPGHRAFGVSACTKPTDDRLVWLMHFRLSSSSSWRRLTVTQRLTRPGKQPPHRIRTPHV